MSQVSTQSRSVTRAPRAGPRASEIRQPTKTRQRRQATLRRRLWRYRVPLALILPGLAFYVVFYYVPLLGNVVAFQDYLPFLGFRGSPFIGFGNFTSLFSQQQFWWSVINTIEITALQLVFFFPAPIILALLLNSVVSSAIRRIVQSIIYLPHFMSWVVVVILFQEIFGGAGVIDQFLRNHGHSNPINFMTNPALFKGMLTVQVIWKETGWGTIIFFAALVAIDTSLYEAALVDGASAWRRTWHVTLPGIRPIIILLLILRIGTILSVGFEQIVLQEPNVGARAGQVLDTYVYFNGIVGGAWGQAAAVGLMKGILGFVLVATANWAAHRMGEQGVM